MTGRVVYWNGAWIPEREARVSIFDSGYLYGETAFEMSRTFQHRPFRLQAHLERLLESLAYLDLPTPFSLEEGIRLTEETLRRNLLTEGEDVDWHIRHDVSRGPAESFDILFPNHGPTVLISCWPLIRPMARFATLYSTGVPVVISEQRSIPPHLIDPRAKTRSRVHFQLAQRAAQRRQPGAWPVLIDEAGCLTEGPSWNLFIVKEGVLISPSGDEILHGVSREITLSAARKSGIPTREQPITPQMAIEADEILCTATSFGIVHANSIEGKPLPNLGPGPILKQLLPEWQVQTGIDFLQQARRYAELLPAWEARERQATQTASRGKD